MTSTPAIDRRSVTEAEYLEQSVAAFEKLEWFDGVVFAMSGASIAHNLVTMNVGGSLRTALRGKPCRVLSADMRVQVADAAQRTGKGTYMYPDLSVVCGDPVVTGPKPGSLRNPSVVVEVLSESTERHDRVRKFDRYTQIPTLRAIVLIDPELRRMECYERVDQEPFMVTIARGLEGSLTLRTFDVQLRGSDVFADLEGLVPWPSDDDGPLFVAER